MLLIPRLSTLILRSRAELAIALVPLIMIPLLLLMLITAVITLIRHAREILDVGTMIDESVVAFFLSDVEWGAVWRIAAQPRG